MGIWPFCHSLSSALCALLTPTHSSYKIIKNEKKKMNVRDRCGCERWKGIWEIQSVWREGKEETILSRHLNTVSHFILCLYLFHVHCNQVSNLSLRVISSHADWDDVMKSGPPGSPSYIVLQFIVVSLTVGVWVWVWVSVTLPFLRI